MNKDGFSIDLDKVITCFEEKTTLVKPLESVSVIKIIKKNKQMCMHFLQICNFYYIIMFSYSIKLHANYLSKKKKKIK